MPRPKIKVFKLNHNTFNITGKTYPESAIPATSAESHSVNADTQAANPIFMARQNTDTLSLQSVPNIACPIIITTKQNATRDGEGNGGNTAQNVVVREGVEFAISSDIEQTTGGIVGTCGEGIAIGEESEND